MNNDKIFKYKGESFKLILTEKIYVCDGCYFLNKDGNCTVSDEEMDCTSDPKNLFTKIFIKV
jgi:hypothetical protein